jgi:hypothetical protein
MRTPSGVNAAPGSIEKTGKRTPRRFPVSPPRIFANALADKVDWC